MLKANSAHIFPHNEPSHAAVDGSSTQDLIGSALAAARRQAWVVLPFLVIGILLAAAFLLKVTPNFTANATLLIDTRKIEILQQPAVFGQMSLESSAAMESQVEILKSEKIALAVVQKLGLANEPEFVRVGKGLRAALFGGLFSVERPPLDEERTARALGLFAKRLTVNRVGNTYAIEIGFESESAVRAAQVANEIADAYIERQLTSQYNAARQASDYLETRIQELRGQSETAQRAVVEYKKQNNIVETEGGRLVNDQRIADLTSQLNIAQDDTNKAKAKFDQLDALIRAGSANAILGAPIDDAAESEAINKLRRRYHDFEYREADWASRYGSDHLAVVNLRTQMDQARSEIMEEFRHLNASRKSEHAIASTREAGIRTELAEAVSQSQAANQAQVKLRELEAAAKTYQALYDSLLSRYASSLQEQTSPVAEASVITRASPSAGRNYKKSIVVAALFPIAGLAAGIGLGLLRELFGRVFWTAKPIETSLGTVCIGILPKVRSAKTHLSLFQMTRRDALDGSRNVVRGDRVIDWSAIDHTFSRFSEGLRSIRLAADRARAGSNEIVGFTSALPNEGKSTVALSFGQLIARAGARAIVVDCDLRNPSLTRSIAPNAASGILELISGKTSLEEIIWRDPATQLDFLPAVLRSKCVDSYQILASDEMKRIFEELKKRYEYVVVDLSPLAPIVDVTSAMQLVDSYVLVVEWGRTKIDIVQHVLHSAPDLRERLLGVVLNKVDIKRLASYDSRLFDYYCNKRYKQYGYSGV